jgi:hypothetical protein
LVSLSDVARMSDPHAEISTAGVIIAERTEVASGMLVIVRPSRVPRIAAASDFLLAES